MTDIPMRDIVEVMLAVKCRAYSFEAANVRHEHEWKVWQDVKLPDGKLILPGIVSHATNVVEHPELVAERIARFANAVGKERVIASTDCGLGGRVHCADRLGEARSPRAGRRAGDATALALANDPSARAAAPCRPRGSILLFGPPCWLGCPGPLGRDAVGRLAGKPLWLRLRLRPRTGA